MAEITSITVQKKDKNRCNIYLDNVFFCGLQTETVIKHGLKKGMEVTEEFLSKIQFESEKVKALDKALNFIEKSFKTEKEIEAYLKKKGYAGDVCAYVLKKLKEYDFANDLNYAKAFIKSKSKSKGKRMIEYELIKKGVDKKVLDEALSDYSTNKEALNRLAEKHIGKKERTPQNLSKTYKYLLSKGFSYEEAKTAVERLGAIEDD